MEWSTAEVLQQESKRHGGKKKVRRRPVRADALPHDASVEDKTSKAAPSGFCHFCFPG